MFRKLDLVALQVWIGAVCLLVCLGADAWTFLYRRSEFLTSLSFTALVALIQFMDFRKRGA